MKNAKSKNDLESRIIAKINELVAELKVEGKAIKKSIETSAKKIAKHLSKKLHNLEKKKIIVKKIKPTSPGKQTSSKSASKLKKPVTVKPASGVPEPAIVKTETKLKTKPLSKKRVSVRTVTKKTTPSTRSKKK